MREWLTVGPNGTVFEILLFPDRNCLLQGVYQPTASVEGGGAVGRSDRDENAALADLNAAQAMDDPGIAGGELLQRLRDQLFHLLQRHLLISFIFQVKRLASSAVVA